MSSTARAEKDHREAWTGRAAALVQERSLDGAGIAAVVCPAAHGVLASPALRHAACGAVLRAPDGAVWMLRTVGHPWTRERIDAAIAVLTRRLGHLPVARDPLLPNRLARALEVPRVQVLAASLDPVNPGQWDVRRLALALRMQELPPGARDPDPAALAADVDVIERALTARLGEALSRFATSLDAEVLAAVPAAARDMELYRYLAEPAHRRNRLQLAATFPLFLRAAVRGETDGAGALIRRVVDGGAPLVRTLAAQWAVAPSVLRGLHRCPVERIGVQWESNLRALVATLNALPPEFRPGADPAAWQAFNEAIAFAESVFGRRPWTSPLALAWLRHAARRGWTAEAMAEASGGLTDEAVALVDQLRQALIELLRAESGAADDGERTARAWNSADAVLAGMTPKRLLALARRYRRELAAARRALADEIEVTGGSGFWPLLPHEIVSSDRLRIVVPLADRQALLRQGREVVNCLGQSHLDYYATACARGDAFIVAVLHAATRAPLSTAEVHVRQFTLRGRHEVRVVQHTAARNAAPSFACRDALAEAIVFLRTDVGQEHLRRGARALAGRRLGDASLRREVELLPVRQAVRATVGERRYDELASAFG